MPNATLTIDSIPANGSKELTGRVGAATVQKFGRDGGLVAWGASSSSILANIDTAEGANESKAILIKGCAWVAPEVTKFASARAQQGAFTIVSRCALVRAYEVTLSFAKGARASAIVGMRKRHFRIHREYEAAAVRCAMFFSLIERYGNWRAWE